jgi:hypothetical protein
MNTPLKDSTSIRYLKRLYKKRFKEDKEISEKDIIYFLRDAMSDVHYSGKINDKERVAKSFYEPEILTLVTAKEWDWHYTDIDKCNILTYALYNKVDEVANYLINHKYDLSVYSKDVSDALTATIRMNNIDYFKKIVDLENIHPQYLVNLNVHSYMAKAANPTGLGCYNDYLSTLSTIHQPDIIQKTIEAVVDSNHDFDKFLELQQFNTELFIEITDNVLDEKIKDMNTRKASQLVTSFSKHKLFHDLSKNLEDKPFKSSKKI